MRCRELLRLILVRLVAVERLIDGRAVVDDFTNREEHRDGGIRLEDIAADIDAGGALVDRVLRELERVAFRQFLAARDHDRDRARVRDLLELLVAVVRLDDVGAILRADAGRESEIARVARQVLADGGDAEGRDSVTLTEVDRLRKVANRRAFVIRIAATFSV